MTELESYIKHKSIEFAEWIDENCEKSFTGFFITDDIGIENGLHEYSIEELYDIYLAQCVEGN